MSVDTVETPEAHLFGLSTRRTFKADVDRVFRAWTEPEILKQWFGPDGFFLATAEVDLRIGGAYRFGMQPPGGEVFYQYGVYREIEPGSKLVFTWVLEGQACAGADNQDSETLVTLIFRAVGDATEVIISHDALPTAVSRDGHEKGWQGSLECLQQWLLK